MSGGLAEDDVPDFGAAVLAGGAFDVQGDDVFAGLGVGVLGVALGGRFAVAELPTILGNRAVGRVLERH